MPTIQKIWKTVEIPQVQFETPRVQFVGKVIDFPAVIKRTVDTHTEAQFLDEVVDTLLTRRRVPTIQQIPMNVEIPQAQFVASDSEVDQTVALPQVQHTEPIIVGAPLCCTTGVCDSRVQKVVKISLAQYTDRIVDVFVVMQRPVRVFQPCRTPWSFHRVD